MTPEQRETHGAHAMTRDEMIKTLESVQTRCIYDSDTDALGDVLAALRAPAVTGEAAEAHGYLSRLLTHCAPQCQPLSDLMGLCSQIDNLIAGLRAAPLAAGAPPALVALVAEWREEADGVQAMGYSQQADRLRDCADELERSLGSPAPAPVAPPAEAECERTEQRRGACRKNLDIPRPEWCEPCRRSAPPAVAGGDAPEIQVGDVVLTERSRLFKVDLIQPRPAHCSPGSWQGARFQYHGDEESGAVALDVAIVAVYREPLWRRRQEGQ